MKRNVKSYLLVTSEEKIVDKKKIGFFVTNVKMSVKKIE